MPGAWHIACATKSAPDLLALVERVLTNKKRGGDVACLLVRWGNEDKEHD
jgi:hypothetical protein